MCVHSRALCTRPTEQRASDHLPPCGAPTPTGSAPGAVASGVCREGRAPAQACDYPSGVGISAFWSSCMSLGDSHSGLIRTIDPIRQRPLHYSGC